MEQSPILLIGSERRGSGYETDLVQVEDSIKLDLIHDLESSHKWVSKHESESIPRHSDPGLNSVHKSNSLPEKDPIHGQF